ncbi:MAG: phosphotransferase [Stappiaceae bacterium]
MTQGEDADVEKEVRQALVEADLAALAGDPALTIQPLPSLTNRAFRVEGSTQTYVVRLPRRETSALLDWANEAANLSIAAGEGLGAPVRFFSQETGVLVMAALQAEPVTPKALRGNARALTLIGHKISALHRITTPFGKRLDRVDLINRTLKPISSKAEPAGINYAVLAMRINEEFQSHDADMGQWVPSHADLVCGNILLGQGRVWLIDWEYSLMADRHWDLAYFSLDAELSEKDEAIYLEAYAKECGEPDARQFALYKCLCDLISGLWAMEQAQLGNTATNFIDYAQLRLARSEKRFNEL